MKYVKNFESYSINENEMAPEAEAKPELIDKVPMPEGKEGDIAKNVKPEVKVKAQELAKKINLDLTPYVKKIETQGYFKTARELAKDLLSKPEIKNQLEEVGQAVKSAKNESLKAENDANLKLNKFKNSFKSINERVEFETMVNEELRIIKENIIMKFLDKAKGWIGGLLAGSGLATFVAFLAGLITLPAWLPFACVGAIIVGLVLLATHVSERTA